MILLSCDDCEEIDEYIQKETEITCKHCKSNELREVEEDNRIICCVCKEHGLDVKTRRVHKHLEDWCGRCEFEYENHLNSKATERKKNRRREL